MSVKTCCMKYFIANFALKWLISSVNKAQYDDKTLVRQPSFAQKWRISCVNIANMFMRSTIEVFITKFEWKWLLYFMSCEKDYWFELNFSTHMSHWSVFLENNVCFPFESNFSSHMPHFNRWISKFTNCHCNIVWIHYKEIQWIFAKLINLV